MAKKDPYIQEAYEVLKHISADEKKRLEYEAREKAIRDYHTQTYSAQKLGEEIGEKKGIASIVTVMIKNGNTAEEISKLTGVALDIVKDIQKNIEVCV